MAAQIALAVISRGVGVERRPRSSPARTSVGGGRAVNICSHRAFRIFDPLADIAQQRNSSDNSWKWIDPHGKEFGIGRPYLDKDPSHVGPIDRKEYADKRGRSNAKLAELETKRRHGSAVSDDHSRVKRRRTLSSKARSIYCLPFGRRANQTLESRQTA